MDSLFPWLAAPSDRLAVRVGLTHRVRGGLRTLNQHGLVQACSHHVHALAARGVAPGARIGVWTQPEPETIVALVAHAAAGYVSVPIDPKLGDAELAHVLRDAAPVLCVAADAATVAERVGAIPTMSTTSVAWSGPTLVPRPIRDEPALVLYTSGTTGAPKGAVITDRNIAANLDMLARAWAWGEGDTVVHALPLFHVHGLVLGLFGSMRRGGALHWEPRFEPRAIEEALGEYPGALLFAVPTMYHRLCEAADARPELAAALRSARTLISGSAPLSIREHAHVERLTGHRVIERYGLTETLINCSTRHDGDRRAGFVGPPLDGVELRLVDDERREIPVGDPAAIGEICVRGPHVFAGYLNNPEATRAVIDGDGWFYTGDLATRSQDGQIRIVGRRSTDLIKCGGFKVGAGEVETALLDHPAVAEAAVIGAPDDDLGERIVAFIVTRSAVGPSELEDHVAARLSPHKRPREVHVVDALPRNAMGKVQKAVLRTRRG